MLCIICFVTGKIFDKDQLLTLSEEKKKRRNFWGRTKDET